MHEMIKGGHDYLLTGSKGINLITFVPFLENIDRKETENLSGMLGVPHVSTPLLNRTKSRRKSSSAVCIEVDGKLVLASQPKKAKRKHLAFIFVTS